MNAIHIIEPRRSEAGIWEFDDEARELKREPFVGEANEVLDYMTRDIPLAHHGVAITFARQPFPDYSFHFTFVKHCKEYPGTWYRLREDRRSEGGGPPAQQPDVWLCPVLLQYFERAPRHLYVAVNASRVVPRPAREITSQESSKNESTST